MFLLRLRPCGGFRDTIRLETILDAMGAPAFGSGTFRHGPTHGPERGIYGWYVPRVCPESAPDSGYCGSPFLRFISIRRHSNCRVESAPFLAGRAAVRAPRVG